MMRLLTQSNSNPNTPFSGFNAKCPRTMPKNQLGKWSLVLVATMLMLFFIGMSFTNLLYKSVPASSNYLGRYCEKTGTFSYDACGDASRNLGFHHRSHCNHQAQGTSATGLCRHYNRSVCPQYFSSAKYCFHIKNLPPMKWMESKTHNALCKHASRSRREVNLV